MDAQIPRLIRNFGWLALAEVGSRLIGLAVAIYLARVLGASLYGAVGLSIALVGILEIVVRAGTGPRAMRQVALEPTSVPRVYSEVVGLRITIGCALIVIVYLTAPSVSAALSIPADLLVLYSFALVAPALTTAWAFRGLERMHVVALGSTLRRLIVLLGLLGFVTNGAEDLLRIPVIEVIAALCMVAGYWVMLRREYRPLAVRFSVKKWPAILREALPVSLGALLGLVYVHGDVLLLGWLADSASAGQFLVAHMIVLAFSTLIEMLNKAAFPATSRLAAGDTASALRLHADLYRCSMLVIAPIVAYGAFYSNEIITTLFGHDFTGAHRILTLLLMTLPIVALNQSLRHISLALARSSHLLIGVGLGASVHVALAVVLIPKSGPAGAALACLLGEAVSMVALLLLVRTAVRGVPLNYRSFAPFLAGGALAVMLMLIDPAYPVARLLLSAAAYLIVVSMLKGITKDDLQVARRLFLSVASPKRGL